MAKAIISVSDKSGLQELARHLSERDYELLASSGTKSYLEKNNISSTEISDYTKSAEILGGRVKTLHPKVYGGILSRDTPSDTLDLASIEADVIDIVVVNLYPFQAVVADGTASIEDAIENIDIGGVSLIRAGAKNYKRVCVLTSPDDYDEFICRLENEKIDELYRKQLAIRAFQSCSAYDLAIANYFGAKENILIQGTLAHELRYGENPHQTAKYYSYKQMDSTSSMGGEVIHGKPLSYNNYLDIDTAWKAVVGFEDPCVCIVKHSSPCGIAVDGVLERAYQNALACDPISAFGSIIASNKVIDSGTASLIRQLFCECVVAPGFSKDALAILKKKKNLRLIIMPDKLIEPGYEIRSVNRGFLMQDFDLGDPNNSKWEVVSNRQPTESEMTGLKFGWRAVQFLKSNAVLLAKENAAVGIGSGQPNRVDCVKIAIERAGVSTAGSVMASDAFFPFADSIESAAKEGIRAIIQPGGSIRDKDVIEAVNQNDMAMIFTGIRHFRH